MKVLLLNPPSIPGSTTDRRQRCTVKSPHNWVHPPIALAYIASCLKRWDKAEVKLIDAVIEKYDLEDVIKIVKEFKPKLIISPIGSYSFPWDFKILSKIKAEFNCLTLAFGELPTAFPEKFLNEYKNLDFCISGEPEIAMSKLTHYLEGNLDIKKVSNLSYKINNRLFSNPVEIIEDLDSIPFPDRSLLKNEKYIIPKVLEKELADYWIIRKFTIQPLRLPPIFIVRDINIEPINKILESFVGFGTTVIFECRKLYT